MEPKKTEKADLTNKSGLFFNIGLVVSLLIMVMAFEYSVRDNSADVDLAKNMNMVEEIMEVPPTDQPPPPPPKIQQPQIIEVPDEEDIKEEIKVEFDVEVTTDTKVEEITIAPVVEEKEDVDQIFLVVEESASPKGGMAAFYKFVSEKMKYPAQARRMGVEGKVFVEFVINRDGSITDVKAIKGIGAGCDEEAVRVVQSAPPWNPGKQRGKPVRQRYVVPIIFKLG
ncbi:MAG: energy transducer TonB [Cyclobacteriaceae bacterium]|jgi:protein TonB|nr:energy transducer TonB [Cyclobacteriaceae bacterium]